MTRADFGWLFTLIGGMGLGVILTLTVAGLLASERRSSRDWQHQQQALRRATGSGPRWLP